MTQNHSEGKDRQPLPGCVRDVQSSLENRFVKKGAGLMHPIQMKKQVVTAVVYRVRLWVVLMLGVVLMLASRPALTAGLEADMVIHNARILTANSPDRMTS